MAGDWMKIELELPDKPEVHAIAATLDIDPDAVVGKLIRLWQWFDKHTTDGNAYGVTYLLADRISGVAGFGAAMNEVGWLEQRDKVLVMPKFDRHTSASAKERALTARRVANHKARANAEANAEGNAPGVNTPLPREEKRRDISITSVIDNVPSPEKGSYTPEFETAWGLYPKRAGGNSKTLAFKAWNARIKLGVTADDLIEGVKRYAAYCQATDRVGTEYVKQASSFFGPGEHFKQDWKHNGQPASKSVDRAGAIRAIFGDDDLRGSHGTVIDHP